MFHFIKSNSKDNRIVQIYTVSYREPPDREFPIFKGRSNTSK